MTMGDSRKRKTSSYCTYLDVDLSSGHTYEYWYLRNGLRCPLAAGGSCKL